MEDTDGKNDKKVSFEILQPPPLPIPKIFFVVYLLNLRSECLVSYDPHFPGNDGTKNSKNASPAPLRWPRDDPPIILQIYFSTKKTKKTAITTKNTEYGFLNSQSMVFKIETYNSSKLLLYKREKKDKCAKYVFWKYKVWFLNYKPYFFKIKV